MRDLKSSIVASLTPESLQPDDTLCAANSSSSSLNNGLEPQISPEAICSQVGKCCPFPRAVRAVRLCRATSRLSIRMTFIDYVISQRRAKRSSTEAIRWRKLGAGPAWPPPIPGNNLHSKASLISYHVLKCQGCCFHGLYSNFKMASEKSHLSFRSLKPAVRCTYFKRIMM